MCGSPKKQPRTSSIVQFILFFWSFEISENILTNRNFHMFRLIYSKHGCLTAIKAKVIKYCETVYERSGKNMFWPIKKSGGVLSKLKGDKFVHL